MLTVATDPSNCMFSAWLIFLAMVFDALDGYMARLAKSASEFGAELDSLCDMVSFGVAPAFLLVKMCPQFSFLHKEAVWVIAASYAVCAALRLARFNVETSDEDDHMSFRGLPSPAAAASVAGFAILFHTLRDKDNSLVRHADRHRPAVHPAFFCLNGGHVNGFAGPLSPRGQPGLSRTADAAAPGGRDLHVVAIMVFRHCAVSIAAWLSCSTGPRGTCGREPGAAKAPGGKHLLR